MITPIPTGTPADRAIRIRAALLPHFGSEAAIDAFIAVLTVFLDKYALDAIEYEISIGNLIRIAGELPLLLAIASAALWVPQGA